MLTIKRYLFNLLIALDQLGNALLAGNPDETISSRMGKKIERGECIGCFYLCRFLSWLFRQEKHCIQSIERDEHDPFTDMD